MNDPLLKETRYLKGVGPERAKALEEAGIRTVLDLLHAFPRRHIDRGLAAPIAMVPVGEPATLQGTIASIRERRTARRKLHILEVSIRDDTGKIPVTFFNQRWLKRAFREGDTLLVTGTASEQYGLHFQPSEFEVLSSDDYEPIHAEGLVPSYSLPEGFGRKGFRRLMWNVLQEHAGEIPEFLPEGIRKKRNLMPGPEAVRSLHFPEDSASLERARARLAYEELFLLQVQLALRRLGVREETPGVPLSISKALDFRIRSLFPFKLTRAQERVIGEMRADLVSGRPMNRLLQGDVGSGKTIVAAYALLSALGNHAQAAIMAPTEVLAEQHYRTFSKLLEKSRVRMAYLGGRRGKEREEIIAKVASGELDLLVGTHAVVQKDVRFRKLAVAVVDEQQKFGVLQRAALRLKGKRPHVLVMTATPIPRTLMLTLFGDLDVSVLDEMPAGRRPVRTVFKPTTKLGEVRSFVRAKLKEGRQAYFVYPLIGESDRVAAKAAKEMHGELVAAFPKHRVDLLHGRMKTEEKERVMESFRSGKTHVLVSTIVVEVGIDVPNATVMVIDNAERYGLSQLHQLRGRIGRGEHESVCFVSSEKWTERLKAFAATSDGFRIAEEDLRIRGPGELVGTKQSGIPAFRVANLVGDAQLLGWARDDARGLVERDPALAGPPGPALRRMMNYRFGERVSLMTVG